MTMDVLFHVTSIDEYIVTNDQISSQMGTFPVISYTKSMVPPGNWIRATSIELRFHFIQFSHGFGDIQSHIMQSNVPIISLTCVV